MEQFTIFTLYFLLSQTDMPKLGHKWAGFELCCMDKDSDYWPRKVSRVDPQSTEEPVFCFGQDNSGQSHTIEMCVSPVLKILYTIFWNLVWIRLFIYKSISENLQYCHGRFLELIHRVQKSQPLADVEVFIPELVENYAEDNDKYEYRFLCPHAGQFMCKLTNLMFEMDGKGEVRYRIVSWDSHFLDGLGQKEPAGPLYSIDCHEGSVLHLHLPHCEICIDRVELTVAHVTGGNVEIIRPLKVTNTHVSIDIQGLSLFSLFRALFPASPIKAQVLLFYKKIIGTHGMSKLHMHLLPGNVPVKEVQRWCESNMYIETSSECELTPGKNYRPCSKNYIFQPKVKTFECNYGPNYHPTFEVFFNTEVDKVSLGLLDENDQEVWEPRLVLLTGTEAASPNSDTTGADFMDRHREELIQRVSSVMEIADHLKSKDMITDEMYQSINAESTSYKQMRLLYRCLKSGGRAVKAEAFKVLRVKEPFLVDDLESGLSQS